jgi:hypothetical protein
MRVVVDGALVDRGRVTALCADMPRGRLRWSIAVFGRTQIEL